MGRNAGDVSLLPTFTAGLAVFRRSGGSTCGVLFHLSLALLAKLVVALSNADHWIPYFLERCRLPQCHRRDWISCPSASNPLRSAGLGWQLGGEVDRSNPFSVMEAFGIRSDSSHFLRNNDVLIFAETMTSGKLFQF